MRVLSLAILFFVASGTTAQTVTPRGTASTFDVASWNIEWFGQAGQGPSNDALQVQNVAAIIRQADIDLWALQEIVDVNDFNLLLQELQADGYEGILGPAPRLGGDQRLAYIYNPDVVTVVATRTILGQNENDFAYRYPFEMLASVSIGDATQSMQIINLHAKCCGDQSSYQRRTRAAAALKNYTDQLAFDSRAAIVLGDFNDELNQSIAGGLSPYRSYYTDTATYTIATRGLNDSNIATYCSNSSCSSGSTLDHVLFTQDLAASYVETSGDRYIELVSSVSGYTSTTSDHLPVLASFTLVVVADEAAPEASGVTLLAPAPNPFRGDATVRFRVDTPTDVQLDLIDALGRHVGSASGAYASGDHVVRFDGAPLAAGVYTVRLVAGGAVQTQSLVRAH